MSAQANKDGQLYQYSMRLPRPLWDRFQRFLSAENKRIGRAQLTSEAIRQVFEAGLSKLEKQ